MISVFENYLTMPMSLSLADMEALHRQMMDEIGNDADSLELYEELLTAAAKYISFRSNWLLWSREERQEKDASRTMCHDAVIVRFNQLARYLKMQGKPAAWRDTLGDESADGNVRKRIGDFACYLSFINSILAR